MLHLSGQVPDGSGVRCKVPEGRGVGSGAYRSRIKWHVPHATSFGPTICENKSLLLLGIALKLIFYFCKPRDVTV